MFRQIILSKAIPMVVCRAALGMFLTATAAGGEPAAAASPGPVQMVQYNPNTYYGASPGITSQQLLALGAQRRAMANDMAAHAMGRLNSTLNQAHHFDMTVINGCGYRYGIYYC